MHRFRRSVELKSSRRFGRATAVETPRTAVVDDVRLFVLTFAGGFLFMAVYLA